MLFPYLKKSLKRDAGAATVHLIVQAFSITIRVVAHLKTRRKACRARR
jgi:hypothetical protein